MTYSNLRFAPNWRLGLLGVIAILFLIRLGFWQLQRADEKTQMLAANSKFAKQDPKLWGTSQTLPTQYQSIIVSGQYLPFVILHDNQHYKHQFGFHALSPFLLANGKIVLVDRGWLAGSATRQSLPKVEPLSKSTSVTGQVYFPSEKNWLLGPIVEKEEKNLVLVELIDTQVLSQLLHKPVYPFIIRLGQREDGGFIREWPVVAMTPQRHYAYALQWFVMAMVGSILLIALNIKKKT